MADPTPGMAKAGAAVVAGALSTIVVYVLDTYVVGAAHQLPAEIVGAIQTLITGAAVFFTPHKFGGAQ